MNYEEAHAVITRLKRCVEMHGSTYCEGHAGWLHDDPEMVLIETIKAEVEKATQERDAELAALRPLKPIAEAAIAQRLDGSEWRGDTSDALADAVDAYLAAQEGGTK